MNYKSGRIILITPLIPFLFACIKQSATPDPRQSLSSAIARTAQTMADNLAFGSATLYNDDNHYCYSYIRDKKLVVPYWERDKKCTSFALPQGFTPSANWNGWDYSPIMGEVGKGKWIGITDCSGFAADIINRVSPAAFKEFVSLAHQESPSKKWYQPWPDAANYAHLGPFLVKIRVRQGGALGVSEAGPFLQEGHAPGQRKGEDEI